MNTPEDVLNVLLTLARDGKKDSDGTSARSGKKLSIGAIGASLTQQGSPVELEKFDLWMFRFAEGRIYPLWISMGILLRSSYQ